MHFAARCVHVFSIILTINSYDISIRIIVLASITDMDRVPCEVRSEILPGNLDRSDPNGRAV